MQVTRIFRSLIVGDDQFITSRAEFKRIMLAGYLALLCVVSNWAYMLIINHDKHLINFVLNCIFCFSGIITLLLIRLRKYTASKLVLFLPAYSIIFIFCITEPFSTGVYIFFIVCNVGALALFGFEERLYSISLIGLSGVLFFLAYLSGLKFLDLNLAYSDDYIFSNFILNFCVSVFATVLILYFLIDLNHYSERSIEVKETEALEKNKELTKLNTELDRFVYSVSHDLRSPLSTISGLVNIGKQAESLDEAKNYFAMIDDRLKAQDFFIREIIDFYRNTRTDINRESFPLRDQVQDIVKEFSMGPIPAPIDYQVQIPSDLAIQSDRIRLKSVLSNLIGNAVKYHDQQKLNKFVRIGAERNNGHIEIFVEDNGQGIGEEHLTKVFDMFYRASADSKGSGLGLFIAKETVNKLGGHIKVKSQLGKGTKFTVTVPHYQNEPEKLEPAILN
jgi:signal transduction histidine kinase